MATKEFNPLEFGATPVEEFDPTAFGATPVIQEQPKAKEPILDRLARYTDVVFGGGKIGEAIGTGIGYAMTPKEQRKNYDTSIPSFGQLGGSALQSGSLFIPAGRLASAGTKALSFLGKAAPLASRVGTGALAGEAFDIATNLQEGKTGTEALTPGLGTAIGGAIPLVGPAIKGAVRAGAETLGATTGTGYGVIKTAYEASKAGGKKADALTKSLRGQITPEQIVNEAKSGLDDIVTKRSQDYEKQLTKLQNNTKIFDHKPVIEKFNEMLGKYGVDALPDGTPDLSRAPGLARYENDLLRLSKVVADWGKKQGDNTLIGIDKLKQTIDDFRIGSQDSKKFDAFVTALRNEAQDLIRNEKGYAKLVGDYGESTALIKEISRGLSLNDRAMVDTAFRKLTTVLRTNNEFRKQLVGELERYSPTLTAKIAGQQLSEALPRGLARVAATYGGGAGLLGGVGLVPLAKALILTSPRVVGEVIRALGLTAKQADKFKNIMGIRAGRLFPGDYLLDETKGGQAVARFATNYAKNPKLGLSLDDISRIHPEDRGLMEKFIDHARTNGQFSDEEFAQVEKLAERFGISMDKGLSGVAKEFENVLTGAKKVKGTTNLGRPFKKESSGGMSKIPKELEPLAVEARKYKSAEEFVRGQRKMYRGTALPQKGELDVADTYGLAYGKGAYLASDESFARSYGDNITELYPVLKKPWVMDKEVPSEVLARIKKDFPDYNERYGTTGEDVHSFFSNQNDANEYLQKLGYDGLLDAASSGSKQTIVFDPKNVLTKSQLIDLYNKATGKNPRFKSSQAE